MSSIFSLHAKQKSALWGRTPTTWQTRRVTHVAPVGMPDHILELVCCHVMLRNVIDVFVHPKEFDVRHCGSLCLKFRFLNGATNPPFRCGFSSVATRRLAVAYFSQQVGRNATYYTARPRRSQCRARLPSWKSSISAVPRSHPTNQEWMVSDRRVATSGSTPHGVRRAVAAGLEVEEDTRHNAACHRQIARRPGKSS
jgi:hypothetical protein